MHIHWCHKWLILCSRGQTLSFHSPETLMSNLEVKCFLIRTILAGYVRIWPKIGRRRRLRDCGSQLLLEQFTKYGIYQLVFLLWGIARIKPQCFLKNLTHIVHTFHFSPHHPLPSDHGNISHFSDLVDDLTSPSGGGGPQCACASVRNVRIENADVCVTIDVAQCGKS